MLPTFGTAIVLVPAVALVLVKYSIWHAIGLALWGTFIVGLIDNILGPILMEKGVRIHPFIILLSILGGLEFMGPIGLIAGPVVLSLLVALLDLSPIIVNSDPPDPNKK